MYMKSMVWCCDLREFKVVGQEGLCIKYIMRLVMYIYIDLSDI